jgi:hypothetical protein
MPVCVFDISPAPKLALALCSTLALMDLAPGALAGLALVVQAALLAHTHIAHARAGHRAWLHDQIRACARCPVIVSTDETSAKLALSSVLDDVGSTL